jgi:UDP-N-acetylmuramoyl-tripeptide--D-alanyl-D-alanine ligase
MFELFFPYKTQLTILQLEEYDLGRFLKWVLKNPFKRSLEQKKKLIFTPKAKVILALSIAISLISMISLISLFGFLGFWVFLLLSTQPFLFFSLSVLLLSPFDYLAREKIKRAAAAKIKSLPNLKVIAISGSYGKTSVKEFLYQMLKTKFRVLRTPENYNTMMGIAKVVDLELDESDDFFICEIGAYKIGDIREVCEVVKPCCGILTGINEQHLEKFGGIENTIKAKFELVASLPKNGFCVINTDDRLVAKTYPFYTSSTTLIPCQNFNFTTKLLGHAALQNLALAATMAQKLGILLPQIEKTAAGLQPVPHRLETKHVGDAIFIDDAYSANPTGFHEALNFLAGFPGKKILATPGIVELGDKTAQIHKNLGKEADALCDAVILIGRSNRTKGIEAGLHKIKPIYIDSVRELWPTVEKLGFDSPVVLLENDLPENY